MADRRPFADRRLRLCYWNAENRLVDKTRANLEHHLGQLGDVSLESVTSLESADFHPCDLLIVGAWAVSAEDFPQWLRGLRHRIGRQGGIWTPALILSPVSFDVLSDMIAEVAAENWYFDVVHPDHMASLPIRVANLLRIHDHLHELGRYESTLDDLGHRVRELEEQLTSGGGGEGS